jgi:hypothetical protein
VTTTETPADARQITLTMPRPVTLAAIATATVPFLTHAWMALTGYFGHDDFLITYSAAQHRLPDIGFLFQDYNGHIAPGGFLLAWVVTTLAPLNYVVAVLPLLAMQAAASVLLWRVLVRTFGSRWALLLPFAVYAFSPLILFPTLWWAYGIQLIPVLLAMFGAIDAHLTYLRTRATKHLVITLVWTVAGMAFYEKAALIPAVLLGLTLLLGERVPWRAWLVHGVVLVGYAALYLGLTTSRVKDSLLATDSTVEFVWRTLVDTFLPGLIGGPWAESVPGGNGTVATPPLWVRIAVMLLAAAAIGVSLLKARRRARLAWLLVAAYITIDLALVIVTRLPEIGPLIGTDPRYIADAVPVLALCATFAYLEPGEKPDRGAGGLKRPVVLGLVVLLAISSTYSFLRLAPGLQYAKSKQYVATAQAALEANPSMVLYDAPVPNNIMLAWFLDNAKASRVLSLLPQRPKFDQPAEEMYLLDDNGSPHKITGVGYTIFGKAGPVEKCGYPVNDQIVTIPLSNRVEGRQLLRMEYYTSSAGPARLTLGTTVQEVNFAQGLHELYVVLSGDADHLQIERTTKVDSVCVVDVRIGFPTT